MDFSRVEVDFDTGVLYITVSILLWPLRVRNLDDGVIYIPASINFAVIIKNFFNKSNTKVDFVLKICFPFSLCPNCL